MTVVASNYARKENDLYQTEPWATEALLRNFPVEPGQFVWEPAAGNHLMADVLRDHGANVLTSDITTYGREHDEIFDFLDASFKTKHASTLITNPPYGKGNRDAVKWAELSLQRCHGFVALLLTAKFDFGKTRRHLFRDNPRFCAKIALVDRLSWTLDGETGTEDHAWYIWESANRARMVPIMLWEGRL